MTRDASDSPPEKAVLQALRNSRDFGRVFKQGRRQRTPGVVVVDSATGSGDTRLGLVVDRSKGSAVVRNRIKRRLRHAASEVRFPSGRDFVLVASREVETMDFDALVGQLREAIEEKE